jgi:hypothetical protein
MPEGRKRRIFRKPVSRAGKVSNRYLLAPAKIRKIFEAVGLDSRSFKGKEPGKKSSTHAMVEQLQKLGLVAVEQNSSEGKIRSLPLAKAAIRRQILLRGGNFDRLSPRVKNATGRAVIFLTLNRLDVIEREREAALRGIDFNQTTDPRFTPFDVKEKLEETIADMRARVKRLQRAVRNDHVRNNHIIRSRAGTAILWRQIREIQNEERAFVFAVKMLEDENSWDQVKKWLREQRSYSV